jgi:sortase A
MTTRLALMRLVEVLSWALGIVCLAAWTAGSVDGIAARRLEMQRFVAVRDAARFATGLPDQSLWDPKRIEAWRETLTQDGPPPLAVLRIPRIGLEVPVLAGIDAWTLNRGVGHIAGTAVPGETGNAGIAGHRDGFFRGLKDVQPGDVLQLETWTESIDYRIDRIWVVDPGDVWVLEPTPVAAVTLVTCYPFYFIGPAPRRYIVRALQESTNSPNSELMGPRSN